jgi:hypothetical protein
MRKPSEHLQRLKAMTPDLPSFPAEIQNGRIPGCKIQYTKCYAVPASRGIF